MPRLDADQRRVVGAFGPSPLRRLAVTLRLATCPARHVVDALAPDARVLDVGCGWGALAILAATTGPGRRVTGVDVDAARITAAEQAARHAGVADRVTFRQVAGIDTLDAGAGAGTPAGPDAGGAGSADSPTAAGAGTGSGAGTSAGGAADPSGDATVAALFRSLDADADVDVDTVLIVDVLYLLGTQRSETILRAACRAVGPGGRVVVKEMADTPAWKVRLTLAQEFLATRVTGYTAGRVAGLVPIRRIVGVLESEGARVRVERVDRWDLHPHTLVVADLPT